MDKPKQVGTYKDCFLGLVRHNGIDYLILFKKDKKGKERMIWSPQEEGWSRTLIEARKDLLEDIKNHENNV